VVDSIELTADVASVAAARRFIAARSLEHGLDPVLPVLLTSELVSNVVRHAQTNFTVAVRFEGCLRVEVHDGMAASDAFRSLLANPPTQVPNHSIGGRGLGLIRSLATRFGLAQEPGIWNGKIVWFEIDHTLTAPNDVDNR
jgi:anti-sigma regulatory factor (Ser/Thr protein kinase)